MAETIGPDIIEEFAEYLAVGRGRSEHTVRAYIRDLRDFFDFVIAERGRTSLDRVDRLDVRAWLFARRSTNQNASLGRKLSAVKAFFKYMVREGRLTRNPAAETPRPKADRKQPRFLTVDEAFALMDAALGDDPAEIRDRAVLELA
jgi:integrase/recombinase XerC